MPEDGSPPLLGDAARVRLVLARELETISSYETLAHQAASPHVRAFLLHLVAEEKEHVAEAMAVLGDLDPDQASHLKRPIALTHFHRPASEPPLPGQPASQSHGHLTVGDL